MEMPEDMSAVSSFEALLPGGLKSLPQEVGGLLQRDDYSGALKAANESYSGTQGRNLIDVLVYAILLTHRELAEEALGVLRRGFTYHADEVALQLAQIDALFASGDYEAATALMDALREVPMTNPRHWAYLGDMFWDLDARDEALHAYEQATSRGSDAPDVALRLADLYADEERFHEAAEQFERAGRLAPSDPHIWMAVAEAWMGLDEWDRAVRAAERTVGLAGDDPDAWSLLGAARREAGELAEALEAFEKARNLDPDNAVQWLNLGGLQLELGLADEARQSYQRAASLDSSEVEAFNGMVVAAFDLGDLEMAERLARRAVEIAPENPDSLYNLGVVALSMRRAEQARQAFARARELEPSNPHLTAGLATAVLLEGHVDEALELLDEALELVHDDAELVLEFAQFLFRHGGAARVIEFVERVKCDDPTWRVVVPMFEYLARALRRDEGFMPPLVRRFVDAVRAEPQAIPVLWDFEEVERLSFALEDGVRERFLDMLAVLDGRKDVDVFEGLAA